MREYRESTRVDVIDDAAAQAVVALQAGELSAEAAQMAVANDPAAADRLAQLYAEMALVIADLGPVAGIEQMVAEALRLIESSLAVQPDANDPAAAAVVLSLLTWWASLNLITISVTNRELIEGVTSLIAVAVLFFVTNWLFHKVYVMGWAVFVKEKVGKALITGSALTLAGLGFTVVYREGFETVLFYQALLFDADGTAVLAGFLVGFVIILAVAYAMLRMSKRLPLKPFFTITGILLMLLAFNFTGAGIRELQEAGVVSSTLLAWMPENLVLMETMGIFPTVETTLAQVVFLNALVVTFVWSRWHGKLRRLVQSSRLNQSELDAS